MYKTECFQETVHHKDLMDMFHNPINLSSDSKADLSFSEQLINIYKEKENGGQRESIKI